MKPDWHFPNPVEIIRKRIHAQIIPLNRIDPDSKPKTVHKRQKTLNKRQKTEGRKQKKVDIQQKTVNRIQKTEDRRH